VQGTRVYLLCVEVNRKTGIFAENEHFDCIVFLPLNNGFGAYNRYYGMLSDGIVKVSGIAARWHDTPEYIWTMQRDMLAIMATSSTVTGLDQIWDTVYRIYCTVVRSLPHANPSVLAIGLRISRTTYAHRCIEGAVVEVYRDAGMEIAPGMKISYVVRDARMYRADPEWDAERFDLPYYRGLLEKEWNEIAYPYRWDGNISCNGWTS
jgi:DNA polymerase, archaea type